MISVRKRFFLHHPQIKAGITLMEILISAAILSAFMVGVMNLFRSGSRGLSTGTWKSKAQKEAQLFLEGFRTIIENAGNAIVLNDGAIVNTSYPLQFKTLANGVDLNINAVSANTNIAFLQLFTPCTRNSTIAQSPGPGTWLGAWVIANPPVPNTPSNLILQTTVQPSVLPPAWQFLVPPLAVGSDFTAATADKLRPRLVLNDVSALQFQMETHGQEQLLNVMVTVTRTRPGEPITTFQQSVRANLLKGVTITWF